MWRLFLFNLALAYMLFVLMIACWVLLLMYSILLWVYKYQWNKIPFFSTNKINATTFISVIIPARNEAANIENLLLSILAQTYSRNSFEVVIIDDFSTDETASIVKKYTYDNIRLLSLSDYVSETTINSFKKKAIEIGVMESKGSLLVTTDADCVANENWLANIASYYETYKPAMIVMPVLISPSKSFIELFQSIDFMCMQGITGAAIYSKMHGMCNGANLAYTKQVFMEVGGFSGIDNIASGDDMLLLQKIATDPNNKILYLKSKEVIIQTAPVNTIKDFFRQRIRWASKAEKYQDKSLLPVLALVYFLNVMLLLSFLTIIIIGTPFYWKVLSIALMGKTVIELIYLFPVADFFNKRDTLWIFPLLQPFHICYTVIAGFLGKFGSYQWKSRSVK